MSAPSPDEPPSDGTPKKEQFDFANVLSNMNNILKPVGAEVQMKRKNEKTGEAEECNQEEAVKITNFRIQAAAAQHAMKELTYVERREWLIEKKEEGNQYFHDKNYEKACEMYMQAISGLTTGDTDDEKKDAIKHIQVPLVNNLAACYMALEKFDKVAALSNEVLRLDPNNLKATLRMGHALLELREHTESKVHLLRAIELSQTSTAKIAGDEGDDEQGEQGEQGGSGGSNSNSRSKVARKARKLLAHLNKSVSKNRIASTRMMNDGLGSMYQDKKIKNRSREGNEETKGVQEHTKTEVPTDGSEGVGSDLSSIDTEDEGEGESDDDGIEYGGTMIGHFGSVGPASNLTDCMHTLWDAVVARCCRCYKTKRNGQTKRDELRQLMKKEK